MNPLYQALTGPGSAPAPGTGNMPGMPMGGPLGAVQGVMQRAQQIAASFQNPQQMVRQYFPDAPAEVSNDPNQLLGWLQQTGRVNPQMVQMARQMMGQ